MEKYVVQCYQGQKIRSVWKEREGRWFFSVVDVLRALEVSANPSRYWSDFKRKLRQKTEKEEAPFRFENIVSLKLPAADQKSYKTDMLDEEGRLPRIKGALMADAVATTVGAVLGTATTTTFVESASGVSEGGRTGLTSATTAILFGLSLFLSPIFLAIPSFATAPALIVVGFYMLTNVTHIDFDDFSEALPCYICILAMPFFYSISEGISMGVISYVILNLMTGKAKEKKISALMYVLTVLFILKYVFL